MHTNIEIFLSSIETRNLEEIKNIVSSEFIENLPDRGLIEYARYIPKTSNAVREYINDLRSSSQRATIVKNTYIVESYIRYVECLVWERKNSGKWEIDKFFILKIEEHKIGNIS